MIRSNAHKYPISALCRCLGIARSTYYYEVQPPADESTLEQTINEIFCTNRQVYGSRKIQKELAKQGWVVSRGRICRLMQKQGLESAYSKSKYHTHGKGCNEADIPNELNRQFDGQSQYAVVVSDLTYVRVNYKWNYVCLLLDLFNRQIIGHSAGIHKDAGLVYDAFATVDTDLRNIRMFHTDRGSEFNNSLIEGVVSTFDSLKLELVDYIHWFNHFRLHSPLGYLSPLQFKDKTLKKLSD